jgi:hypothetical protein
VIGLVGCVGLYLVYADLNRLDAPPHVYPRLIGFGVQDVPSSQSVPVYVYLGVHGCSNPVSVVAILAPPAGYLTPATPVAFATDNRTARDFALSEGPALSRYALSHPTAPGGVLVALNSQPANPEESLLEGSIDVRPLGSNPTGSLATNDLRFYFALSEALGFPPSTLPSQNRYLPRGRGVYGLSRRVRFTRPWLFVRFAANLVTERSFGSCYVQVPGVLTGPPSFYVNHLPSLQTGVRRYQLARVESGLGFGPGLPFGLEVDPSDTTVQLASSTPTSIAWACGPPFYLGGCFNGGYVAPVVPDSSAILSNYDFLIGTLLGVLAGLVAASALQFQRPKRPSDKATEDVTETEATGSEPAET